MTRLNVTNIHVQNGFVVITKPNECSKCCFFFYSSVFNHKSRCIHELKCLYLNAIGRCIGNDHCQALFVGIALLHASPFRHRKKKQTNNVIGLSQFSHLKINNANSFVDSRIFFLPPYSFVMDFSHFTTNSSWWSPHFCRWSFKFSVFSNRLLMIMYLMSYAKCYRTI